MFAPSFEIFGWEDGCGLSAPACALAGLVDGQIEPDKGVLKTAYLYDWGRGALLTRSSFLTTHTRAGRKPL